VLLTLNFKIGTDGIDRVTTQNMIDPRRLATIVTDISNSITETIQISRYKVILVSKISKLCVKSRIRNTIEITSNDSMDGINVNNGSMYFR